MSSEAPEFVPVEQNTWNLSAPEFVPPAFRADAAEFVPTQSGPPSWTCEALKTMLDDYEDDSDDDSDSDEEMAVEKASPRSSTKSTCALDSESESEFEQNSKHIQAQWEIMEAPPMLAYMKPPPGLERP